MVDSAVLRAAAVGAAAAACGAAVGAWLVRRRRPAWCSGRFVRIDYASLPRCPLALLTEWIDAAEVRAEHADRGVRRATLTHFTFVTLC